MRTLRTIIRATALVVILSPAAYGRDMAGKFGITPQLGPVIPAGEYGDRREVGFVYGLDVEYFPRNNLSLGVRLFHKGFPHTGGVVWAQFGLGDDEDIWPIDGLGVQAKYYRAASPFTDVFGRLSFLLCRMEFPTYRWDYVGDMVNESGRESETSSGLEIGVGLSRHLSKRISFYSEFEYSLLFTKGLFITKEPAPPWIGYSCWYNAQMVAIKTGLTFYFGGTK